MAMLFQIPARNDLPSYRFRITLSGVIFTLVFQYNGRMDRWIVDINDASNNQILAGIPVLINRNLNGQYTTLAIPEGIMFAVDDTGQNEQPTLYSFGIDKTFYYEDPTQ